MFKTSILVLILLSSGVSQARLCKEIFQKSQQNERNIADIFKGLQQGFAAIDSKSYEVTQQEVKDFNNSSSSYKTLVVFERSNNSTFLNFWMVAMKAAFMQRSLETKENTQKAEKLFDLYSSFFAKQANFISLIHQSKKTNLSHQAKKELLRILKMHSSWISLALGKEVNLLKQSDFLDLFQVQAKSELHAELLKRELVYKEFLTRVDSFFIKDTKVRSTRTINDQLVEHFFGDPHVKPFRRGDRGFYQRNGGYKEVRRLIQLLRVGKEKETGYLADLEVLKKSYDSGEVSAVDTKRFNVLLFLKAVEEIYGKLPFVYNKSQKLGIFSPASYLSARSMVERSEYSRVIVEERMSDYLDRSESINMRIESLLKDIEQLDERATEAKVEISELKERVTRQAILDFDANLEQRIADIFKAEVKLDEIREKLATRQRRQSIEEFYDLNSRWQRLIANKTYNIDGIDYRRVQFTEDVIDFFIDNPILGARYLAAFSKSYVGIKNESGLRRLPSIHPQMRDIKIIRSHGKVRIIGKLIDGTIHFFHIYHSEKPYNNKNIHNIVEHYEP